MKIKIRSSHLASADGSDTLHLLSRLQLECSTTFHLLIPELHRAALLSPDTHTHKVSVLLYIYNVLISLMKGNSFSRYDAV